MKICRNAVLIGAFWVLLTSGLYACEDTPGKLSLSVSGATAGSTANYYVVQIPDPNSGDVTVTLTGSGDTPCPDDCECLLDTQAPTADGDPTYDFTHSVGSQDGHVITWKITSGTTPGEYTFKLDQITQDYKACPDGYTGGSSSESNTQASPEVTVLVAHVSFTSNSPSQTEDGEGADFEIEVLPSGLSPTYSWTFEAPAGAGNNPNVTFTPANDELTTVANAHWFADPGNVDKPPLVLSQDITITPYKIKATVTVEGVTLEAEHEWTVFLPNPLGQTLRAQVEGMPSYAENQSTGKWEVTGKEGLGRFAPDSDDITMFVSPDSQWYNKTYEHELHHLNQWSNIAPWKDYYDVDYFYSGHPTSSIVSISPQNTGPDLVFVIERRIIFLNNQENAKIDELTVNNELERQARVAAHAAKPNPAYYTN